MGAFRYLVGLVCVGLAAGCVETTDGDIAADDLNLDYEAASGPDLPAPPDGATCVLIQRGTLGAVQDTDIGYGNGTDWAAGGYPFSWTGPSPYSHWSLYQFDLSPVPAGSTVVLGVFSNYVSWNEQSSTVRAHAITQAWDEATATWGSFTAYGAVTGWDPAVLGTFDPSGVGFHSLEITGLVQGWHSGATANNGLLLEEDPVVLHTYFASEASTVDMRPSLYVCWVDGAPDPGPQCSNAGGGCGDSADCCEGLACIGGECGLIPPPQTCAADGETCDLATPCCNPDSLCDGTCQPPLQPSNPGGGGDACFPLGAACSDNGLCCSGSCLDGMCTALAVAGTCVEPDQMDADGNLVACDEASPCCAGSHCIMGLCQPGEYLDGGTCKLQGQACDPDNGAWCCWDMWCMGDGTCQPPP